jgi:hypothetical protein
MHCREGFRSLGFTRRAASACLVLALASGAAGCGDDVAEASAEPVATGGRGAGGTGGAQPGCDIPLGDRVAVSTLDAGEAVLANDEYYPVVLAPTPEGGSLVAWRQESGLTIRVAALDDSDQLVGEPLSFPGEEVHAILAHEDGGAIVILENDPDIYSDKYCRGETTPDESYCAKFDLVRFDSLGSTLWRATLTDKINVDSDGALFIWWYQHTARLAWSGREYGVYFRSAGSTTRPGEPDEVDIHAGDTLRFVDADGSLLDGGWDWGCSHSWSVRLAYNGLHWGAACHGNPNPNAHRLVIMDRGTTLATVLLQEGMDPEQRALGGLVPTSDGFWLSHIAAGQSEPEMHLVHIDDAGSLSQEQVLAAAQGIDDGYVPGPSYTPYRAYMADYADGQMLLGYKSSQQLQLAVLDRATGELVDGPVAVDAGIDQFQEFVSHPNGDVGWAWSPGGGTEISVARVRACE